MRALADLRRRIVERRDEFRRLGALVSGAVVCDDLLRELDAIERTEATETLDRREAAAVIGVHPDSITRAIRKGRLENLGSPRRPRVRRVDVLSIGGARRQRGRGTAIKCVDADQIAREAIGSRLRAD